MRKHMKNFIVLVVALSLVLGLAMIPPIASKAASNPLITLKAISNLSSTEAQINATIKNPSKLTIKKVGFVLYDKNGKTLTNKYDNANMKSTEIYASFSMNKYYGKLKAGTTYKYDVYVTTATQTFKSNSGSFTTPSIISNIYAQLGKYKKMLSFVSDPKWKDGAPWNGNTQPKLKDGGYWSSWGCCAYTADFLKYVYGCNKNPRYCNDVTQYTDINKIQAGDIIQTNSPHWFVVLYRDGNNLYTAERSGDKIRISTSSERIYHRINNGKLELWYYGNKYIEEPFVKGYHHR